MSIKIKNDTEDKEISDQTLSSSINNVVFAYMTSTKRIQKAIDSNNQIDLLTIIVGMNDQELYDLLIKRIIDQEIKSNRLGIRKIISMISKTITKNKNLDKMINDIIDYDDSFDPLFRLLFQRGKPKKNKAQMKQIVDLVKVNLNELNRDLFLNQKDFDDIFKFLVIRYHDLELLKLYLHHNPDFIDEIRSDEIKKMYGYVDLYKSVKDNHVNIKQQLKHELLNDEKVIEFIMYIKNKNDIYNDISKIIE